MKKFLFLILAISIASICSMNAKNVYAQETNTTIIEENLNENQSVQDIEEIEKEITQKIEEYKGIAIEWLDVILTILAGAAGTIAVIVFAIKKIVSIIKETKETMESLRKQKEDSEDKIKDLTKTANNALANLQELQETILTTNKQGFDELKEVLRLMAVGNKELVANGTTEEVINTIGGGTNESEKI